MHLGVARPKYKPKYRPTRLEIAVVVAEVVIMLIFAWSFMAGTPSEAFIAFTSRLGIRNPSDLMIVFSVIGASIGPIALVANSRRVQRNWYRAGLLPLVFYSASIGLYRAFIESGSVTGIIVHIIVTVVLVLLAEATFRDPEPRKER